MRTNQESKILVLLSIVIPVYNRQDRISTLINQLIKVIEIADASNFVEIIVIDDSSDKKIVLPNKSYIKLKHNTFNLGAPESRKVGFEALNGKFVHFHDSDDNVHINWFELLLRSLIEMPQIDILLTGRNDKDLVATNYRFQKYFDRNFSNKKKIQKRLIYRNCMGPLGGVTFSKQVLKQIEFKNFASCQDWQMYLDAINHAEVLVSRPNIKFVFDKTGDDRISYNPQKKILGHLQLSRITSKKSIFKRNIRLFYLYTCKQHIFRRKGLILKFYKKNRIKIVTTFIIVSLYWRLT